MTISPRFAVSRRRSRQAPGQLCMEQRRAMVDPQDSEPVVGDEELADLQGGGEAALESKRVVVKLMAEGE